MFRKILVCLSLMVGLVVFPVAGYAKESVDVYLFYSLTCPHCETERDYLDNILDTYENVTLHEFEVYYDRENAQTFKRVGEHLDVPYGSVPYLVIGDETIIGYAGDDTTGVQIRERIDYCIANRCPDTVYQVIYGREKITSTPSAEPTIIDGVEITPTPQVGPAITMEPTDIPDSGIQSEVMTLPILGEIDVKTFSLPLITIVLGFLDGFNPCAMWVLLFLISLLLGIEDRRRQWVLGLTFIGASALVYFGFLAAWLNLFMFIGYVYWIRVAVALVALIGGYINLKRWYKAKTGCSTVNTDSRRKVFEKLKKITQNEKLLISLIGIILLAVSVNLVELVCSAGLPAIFSQILTLNELSTTSYYGYLLLYIFVFMLDDLVVFVIAMVTLKATAISTKYGRLTSLIGGVLMVIIGILMLFKPEILMFNF